MKNRQVERIKLKSYLKKKKLIIFLIENIFFTTIFALVSPFYFGFSGILTEV